MSVCLLCSLIDFPLLWCSLVVYRLVGTGMGDRLRAGMPFLRASVRALRLASTADYCFIVILCIYCHSWRMNVNVNVCLVLLLVGCLHGE